MKRALLLLLLLPNISFAKNWRVDIGGGVSTISEPNSKNLIFRDTKAMLSPELFVRADRAISDRVSIGLDLSAGSLIRHQTIDLVDQNANTIGHQKLRIYASDPGIFLMPSISYNINGVYLGVQAGALFSLKRADEYSQSSASVHYNSYTSAVVGVHAGYSHKVYHRFSAFLDIRTNAIPATLKIGASESSVIFFQSGATIGGCFGF